MKNKVNRLTKNQPISLIFPNISLIFSYIFMIFSIFIRIYRCFSILIPSFLILLQISPIWIFLNIFTMFPPYIKDKIFYHVHARNTYVSSKTLEKNYYIHQCPFIKVLLHFILFHDFSPNGIFLLIVSLCGFCHIRNAN